jgi:hypothetical protein
MVEAISRERWQSAQVDELVDYDYGHEESYKNSSRIILQDYFGINPETDLVDKKIIESGGGCYPSIYFCVGLSKAVNVEPLYDQFPEHVQQKLVDANIQSVSTGFEDYKGKTKFDEAWFFNVLTHVMDPSLQIQIAKRIAKTVRIFEPLNTAINNEHPHSLDLEFFQKEFPDTELKVYQGGTKERFHQANCVYLTYNS